MRTKTLTTRGSAAAAALAFWMALPLAARADEARAVLSPPSISLDDSAELRIPSQEDVAPEPPVVPGLVFRPVGQSSEMSVVNGQVAQHTWTLYQVSARQAGSYRIPIGTQQLTLTVEPAGGGAAPQPQAGDTAQPAGAESGPLAFLRALLPQGRFYVGQAIPISFKAYFRPGTEVTIAAPPSLGNPTFTISDLSDKPTQGTQIVGGREYGTATWTALISGTMPGALSAEVTLPIEVRYREASRSSGSAQDPFGDDPFADDPTIASMMKSLGSGFGAGFGNALQAFDNPFGAVRQRELTLHSPAEKVTLLPLPLAGRPPSFSGAVGRFEVSAQLTPSAGVAFEPMSLQLAVSGQGNFDRVALAGLASAPDFKAYPASSSFAPSSAHSTFTGTKTFVQPIVPQHSGALALPAVAFSFFDPKAGAYVTKSVSPPPVTVAAGEAGPAVVSAPVAEASAASASTSPDGLRPDHAGSRLAATLMLPERQPWFWAAVLLPLLGLGLALAVAQRRRSGTSARVRRKELGATLAAQRIDMRKAVERRDAAGFFGAAQVAVQAELARRWHLPPQAVTDVEIHNRLGEKGRPLADVLRLAESVLYGGARVDPDALSAFDTTLEGLLTRMEVAS